MGLDKYDIKEQQLATGPSVFYRARNKILGNDVMVRRLAIDPSRPDDVRETFYREQRHSAALPHPNLQQPLDVFEEDGYLWSVHEHHVTRSTLNMVREDGPFPIAEVGRLGAQVADALAFMHDRHFLHGKVQPGFVLVNERNDATLINLVKGADLAAGLWPLRPAVLGLSPFSAPEEFRGERPTFQSDVYGLAGTIFFWLTARWPRGGKDDEDALSRAAAGAPLVNLPGLRPEVPRVLADALFAALEPDPDARHGSVSALGSILSEIHQRQAAEIPSGFQTGALLMPTGRTSSVQILGRHGSGAFGVVLRAKNPDSGSEGTLAVKALKPEHRDDSEARERFVREAQSLQAIDHPNVVHVRGVGEENGTPYVVMDFISGPDLATFLLREGALDPALAAKIGAGIAAGLAAIHQEQIVHRDLKPHNILVAKGDRPVIADFGVARNANATRLTMTGNVLGTPAYMAPEQFDDEPATHAVDLFALGGILYEMVSSSVPFPAADAFEMIRAVRTREPAPLPDDVPEDLKAVIDDLLVKDPADRLSDAAVAVERLTAIANRLSG